MLPGLVIYHQVRDFWRPIGDKIFVQITSDFLVISDIGQNFGNFKPFLEKLVIFQHFSTKVFHKLNWNSFTNNSKNFLKKYLPESFEILIFRKIVT